MDIFGIPVAVEHDGDSWLVTDYKITMYGDTVAEAVEEYRSVVEEYLEELKKDESILGKYLKGHLEYLRECMEKK